MSQNEYVNVTSNKENGSFSVQWENEIFREALVEIGDKEALELFDKEQEEVRKKAEEEIKEMKKRGII